MWAVTQVLCTAHQAALTHLLCSAWVAHAPVRSLSHMPASVSYALTWKRPDLSPAYSNHLDLGTGTVLCISPMLGKPCMSHSRLCASARSVLCVKKTDCTDCTRWHCTLTVLEGLWLIMVSGCMSCSLLPTVYEKFGLVRYAKCMSWHCLSLVHAGSDFTSTSWDYDGFVNRLWRIWLHGASGGTAGFAAQSSFSNLAWREHLACTQHLCCNILLPWILLSEV